MGAQKLVKNTIEVNPNLTAPIIKGQTYGKVTTTYEGKVVATAPLIALEDVPKGGFFRGLIDSISKAFHHLFGKSE